MSKLNILIIADYLPGDATVIRDHLFSFDRYSNHRVFHLFWPSKHKDEIDFSHFDVVIVHWCIYITKLGISHPSIPAAMAEKIRQSSAIKVLFLQDEYRRMNAVHEAMNELGINLMMTCASKETREQLYPSRKLPSVDGLHTVLTGYIPEYLKARSQRVDDNTPRPVDIGYRSRRLPFSLGKLGYEKTQIYEYVSVRAKQLGIRTDLSISESERIYGDAWHDFLLSSYCQLGTPSGASVIDFTGKIEADVKTFVELRPFAPFEDVYDTFLSDVDEKLIIDTISPRVFEYTAHGCVMLMTEGHYGGHLEPGTHYVQIKKDFSNLDIALAEAMEPEVRAQLLANTRRDLMDNDQFSYRNFVGWFNQLLATEHDFIARGKTRQRATLFHLKQAISQQHPSLPVRGYEVLIPWHIIHKFQQRISRWIAGHPKLARTIDATALLVRSPKHFLYSAYASLLRHNPRVLRLHHIALSFVRSPRHFFSDLGANLSQRFPSALHAYGATKMVILSPRQFISRLGAKLSTRLPRAHHAYGATKMFISSPRYFISKLRAKLSQWFPSARYGYGVARMLILSPRRFFSRLHAKFTKHRT